MSDDRPQPRYGQYAPGPPPAPTPQPTPLVSEPDPVPTSPTAPARRTWDVVLTTVLLLIGTWDVVTSFPAYAELGRVLSAVFEQQGMGDFTSYELATQLGLVANVLRIALLVAAVIVSLVRINRNRIAFWAPLGAGVLAALAVLVCMFVVIFSDPAFASYVESMQL
jgi:hypothetical protein